MFLQQKKETSIAGLCPFQTLSKSCLQYWWIARNVIALLAKPLDVKIADRRHVNVGKNPDSETERIFRL